VAQARDGNSSVVLECNLRLTKHDLTRYQKQFDQYLRWNEQANGEGWRETTDFIQLQAAAVPVSQVEVQMDPDLNLDVAQTLGFGTSNWIVPKHPYNTNSQVAFYNQPAATTTLRARFMASRSLIVWPDGHTPFSVKVGTNFPHRSDQQNYKGETKDDIRIGFHRSQMIAQMDARMRPAEHITILREMLSLRDPKTGEGLSLRDLSPLLDGHYYLPAFSIPYVGHEIAAKFGQSFVAFWGEHYAKALGRAKAELLLRYGLQYDQANAQNIVLQLDESMMPTGHFVFFDLADMSLVDPFFSTSETREWLDQCRADGKRSTRFLNPDSHNSVWQMDDGGVSFAEASQWKLLHDQEWVRVLRTAFPGVPAVKLPGQAVQWGATMAFDTNGEMRAIDEYLARPEGQAALAKYRSEHIKN
jgi:hypothetical protein